MGRNRELSCSLPVEAYFKRRAMESGGGGGETNDCISKHKAEELEAGTWVL